MIYRFDHSKRTLVSATVILAKQFWKTFSKDRSLCFLFSGRLQLFCNGLAFAAVLGKRVGSLDSDRTASRQPKRQRRLRPNAEQQASRRSDRLKPVNKRVIGLYASRLSVCAAPLQPEIPESVWT